MTVIKKDVIMDIILGFIAGFIFFLFLSADLFEEQKSELELLKTENIILQHYNLEDLHECDNKMRDIEINHSREILRMQNNYNKLELYLIFQTKGYLEDRDIFVE